MSFIKLETKRICSQKEVLSKINFLIKETPLVDKYYKKTLRDAKRHVQLRAQGIPQICALTIDGIVSLEIHLSMDKENAIKRGACTLEVLPIAIAHKHAMDIANYLDAISLKGKQH